jgi:hypothetical protein
MIAKGFNCSSFTLTWLTGVGTGLQIVKDKFLNPYRAYGYSMPKRMHFSQRVSVTRLSLADKILK